MLNAETGFGPLTLVGWVELGMLCPYLTRAVAVGISLLCTARQKCEKYGCKQAGR